MKKAAGKYKTDSFLYVLLHQRPDPVQKPQYPACKDPVQDHRSGDGEDLASDPEYLSLLLVLDRRRCHRVGKSCDGNERSGAAPFRKPGINTGSGEENTEKNKEKGSPAAALLR